jgi:MerR family transcriptional regulator, mercuric resistance operon regulatory protein
MVRSQAKRSPTISWLARSGGVGVETVRFYQRRGLLRTPKQRGRAEGGGVIRHYDATDVRRLRFIKAAQSAGFTLEEIRELLRLDAGHDHARARELASMRIAALDARITELEKARDSLTWLSRRCRENSTVPCPILSAFED